MLNIASVLVTLLAVRNKNIHNMVRIERAMGHVWFLSQYFTSRLVVGYRESSEWINTLDGIGRMVQGQSKRKNKCIEVE